MSANYDRKLIVNTSTQSTYVNFAVNASNKWTTNFFVSFPVHEIKVKFVL